MTTLVKVSGRGHATVHVPDCGHLKLVKPSNQTTVRVRSVADVLRFSWNTAGKCCESQLVPETRRCASCGANLTIGPGITVLTCPLCGSRAIGTSDREWQT